MPSATLVELSILKSAQVQDQRRHRNESDRARRAAETAEQRERKIEKAEGEGSCQARVLLKLLVKDKLPHSRVVNAKEWQLKPLIRLQLKGTNEGERMAAETPEERERIFQQMSTNQHEMLAVETPEEREKGYSG